LDNPRERILLCLVFERLARDVVEVVADVSPMATMTAPPWWADRGPGSVAEAVIPRYLFADILRRDRLRPPPALA